MAGDVDNRVRSAADAVLTDREQVDFRGQCWGAQWRPKVPLLFVRRRRYHMVLTDRRMLVFTRRRRGPDPADLMLGKRYNAYTIDKVRRGPVHLQVRLRAENGNRLVFEFRRRQRTVARELVERLEANVPVSKDPSHVPPMTALLDTPPTGAPAVPPSDPPSDPAPELAPELADDSGEPTPAKTPKVSRKERKRLAREAKLQLDEDTAPAPTSETQTTATPTADPGEPPT